MHPDTPDVLLDAAEARIEGVVQAVADGADIRVEAGTIATGDLTRLDMHPDDLLGNESVRALCAHHLGQEGIVTRPTLLKWRRTRGFPEPLPCGRAGVELWDARQVRVWIQEHARALPKTRPANLRKAPGNLTR